MEIIEMDVSGYIQEPRIRDDAGFVIAGGGGLLRRTLVRRDDGTEVYVDLWEVTNVPAHGFQVVVRNTESHPQPLSEVYTKGVTDDFYGDATRAYAQTVEEFRR